MGTQALAAGTTLHTWCARNGTKVVSHLCTGPVRAYCLYASSRHQCAISFDVNGSKHKMTALSPHTYTQQSYQHSYCNSHDHWQYDSHYISISIGLCSFGGDQKPPSYHLSCKLNLEEPSGRSVSAAAAALEVSAGAGCRGGHMPCGYSSLPPLACTAAECGEP